jgi:hypothetical protein
VDWDKDHADLKWTKPENDGGAPITGYIIEFKVSKMSLLFLYSPVTSSALESDTVFVTLFKHLIFLYVNLLAH